MGRADCPDKKAVIVFLKAPEKGRVKTRLSKTLSESFVLDLYKGFIHDTLSALPLVADKLIYFLPSEKEDELRSWLGNEYPYFVETPSGMNLNEGMTGLS
jgi:glycosyltransferase A (GT-A) superfamily protein (DUF2064 family)